MTTKIKQKILKEIRDFDFLLNLSKEEKCKHEFEEDQIDGFENSFCGKCGISFFKYTNCKNHPKEKPVLVKCPECTCAFYWNKESIEATNVCPYCEGIVKFKECGTKEEKPEKIDEIRIPTPSDYWGEDKGFRETEIREKLNEIITRLNNL